MHPFSLHAIRIPLAGPLSIYLLGSVLGLTVSYDMTLSIPWLLWLCSGIMLYIVVVLLGRTSTGLCWAARAIVVMAMLGAMLVVTQYRHLGFESKFAFVTRIGFFFSRPFPPYMKLDTTANAAATFLEGALPLAIGLTISYRGWRLFWGGCTLMIAFGVLLTASRGAWVALAITGALAGFLFSRLQTHRWHGRAWLTWLLALVALISIGLAMGGYSQWQRVFDSALYRAADRLALYRNSLFLALEFPLSGIGPGATFGMIYSRFQLLIPVFYLSYPHNLFLAVWLAQGLLGLLGFSMLLLASGRLVWRTVTCRDTGSSSRIGWGATLGCTAVLLHGLTDSPQYDSAWFALLMIFALFGIMVAAMLLVDGRPLAWIRLSRTQAAAAAILLTGICVLNEHSLLALSSANIAAVFEVKSLLTPGIDDHTRANLYSTAIFWAERGLWIAPDSQAALKERGRLAFTLPQNDFATAIHMLEPALYNSPADQSLRKALGFAYIWKGRVQEGVELLKEVDRADEISAELQTWPYAWRDRGRPDLALNAEAAAAMLAAYRHR